MQQYTLQGNLDDIFARLGVAWALNDACTLNYTVTYDDTRKDVVKKIEFTPNRLFTIEGVKTCVGTATGRPARIKIELGGIATLILPD